MTNVSKVYFGLSRVSRAGRWTLGLARRGRPGRARDPQLERRWKEICRQSDLWTCRFVDFWIWRWGVVVEGGVDRHGDADLAAERLAERVLELAAQAPLDLAAGEVVGDGDDRRALVDGHRLAGAQPGPLVGLELGDHARPHRGEVRLRGPSTGRSAQSRPRVGSSVRVLGVHVVMPARRGRVLRDRASERCWAASPKPGGRATVHKFVHSLCTEADAPVPATRRTSVERAQVSTSLQVRRDFPRQGGRGRSDRSADRRIQVGKDSDRPKVTRRCKQRQAVIHRPLNLGRMRRSRGRSPVV